MKVIKLKIENFRGIKSANLSFSGHTLLVGGNNVGKSSICEALDLVLGPDRLNRFPPVEEFDFYNARYLEDDGETTIPIKIEVLLTDLSPEVERICFAHTELWHIQDERLLDQGEADLADPSTSCRCLRLQTIARYNADEDEFEADTYFSHSPSSPAGELSRVTKNTKKLFGFLYLRTLRTGSRALTLERGSLLDLILRLKDGSRTGLWESAIHRLRDLDPAIDAEADGLAEVLAEIESRLSQYIPMPNSGDSTHIHVSQLTREHLRKTISFFLKVAPGQAPVPFQSVGTGTINALVLALLTLIAELKKDTVIFAMEEPEIALAPHTQRRISRYLLDKTTQCFVTSHSPYVIEQFSPEQIGLLRRDSSANLSAVPVSSGTSLKGKLYKRHARRGLAEAMLGPGVIVAEGITELSALRAVAEKMEDSDENNHPLDLSGITIFPVDGDGSLPAFGSFFQALGLKTYAFYDYKPRKPAENQKFTENFNVPYETKYRGIEELLVNETPVDRQWQFLDALRQSGEQGDLGVPASRPGDDGVKDCMLRALRSNKGNGYAGSLIDICAISEMPVSITNFLARVYLDFPPPSANSPAAATPSIAPPEPRPASTPTGDEAGPPATQEPA